MRLQPASWRSLAATSSMHELSYENSFDLLRIMAAAAVVFSHSLRIFAIGADPTLIVFPRDDLSSFGVMIFFAVSGYLVSRSALRTDSLAKFAYNRALRILPGLSGCLLITVLLIGPLATNLPLGAYFTDWQTYRYWLNIFLFPLQTELPGVFQDNPRSGTVNGSLWTLSSEIVAYTLVGLAFLWRQSAKIFISLMLLALVVYYVWSRSAGDYPLLYHMVEYGSDGEYFFLLYFNKIDAARLIAVFVVGAIFNYVPIGVFRVFYLLPSLALMVLTARTPLYELVALFVVPYAAVTLGRRRFCFANLLRRSDLSYGVYLYHAPLMQLTWATTHSYLAPAYQVLLGIFLTVLVAAGSWFAIERPALRAKGAFPKMRHIAQDAEAVKGRRGVS